MNNQDFIELIENCLSDLDDKISQLVDRELCDGIRKTLSIAPTFRVATKNRAGNPMSAPL